MYPNLRETTTPTPTGEASAEQLAEAQRYIEQAKQRDRSAQESFERCDTDGFLTQWAAGVTASEFRAKAGVLENGGTSVFRGLYFNGQRLKAKMVQVYNHYTYNHESKWLCDLDEPFTNEVVKGRKWLPTRGYGRKSRIQDQLGIYEADERDWAWIKVVGDKTNCGPSTIRVGDPWGEDAIYLGRTHADLEKRSLNSYDEACKIAKETGEKVHDIEKRLRAEIYAEYDKREKIATN